MEAHQKNLAEDLSQNLSLCSEQVGMKELEDHYQDPLWKRNDQQLSTYKQHNTDTISTRGVPLRILISLIVRHLDRSKVRELQSHFTKLKRNEINKEDFMRFTRQIAGRQLLRMVLANIQLQANKVEEDNRQTSAKDFYQNVTQEDTRQSWQSMAEHAQQRREGRLRVETEMTQDNWLTKAANLAVRAAVGGDDMLLKWQLMAEHALQTREERLYEDSHAAKGASQAFSSTSSKLSQENWLPENRSSFSTYTGPNFSGSCPLQTKSVRCLSVRDVIADLERNPQMCKSTFIYRLYEGMHASTVEGN